MGFGHRVEAPSKIGRVRLDEARPVPRMRRIILIDAASRKDGAMYAPEVATVSQIQCANDIGPNGSLLVVLAPVDVGAPSAAGCVEDVGGLDAVELGHDLLSVLHPDCCGMDFLALLL